MSVSLTTFIKKVLRGAALALVVCVAGLGFPAAAPATASTSSGPTTGGTQITIQGLKFVQVSSGVSFSLGLTSAGTVFAWGNNRDGQLGNNSIIDSAVPVQVLRGAAPGDGAYLSGVKSISAGGWYSVALMVDGSVFTWGANDLGELGDGTNVNKYVPVQVLRGSAPGSGVNLSGVEHVSAGLGFTLALLEDGSAFSWGANNYGQLGDGSRTDRWTPVPVSRGMAPGVGLALASVQNISAGRIHSLALLKDGTVFSWGLNMYGQLGNGVTITGAENVESAPVQVLRGNAPGVGTFLTGVTSITAGGDQSYSVLSDGAVCSWGWNDYGQLGDGTVISKSEPIRVLTGAAPGGGTYLSGVTEIVSGAAQTFAVMPDSSMVAWGWNGQGDLGVGSTTTEILPVRVLGGAAPAEGDYIAGVITIAAGAGQTLALNRAGEIYSWGDNSDGQLGDGSVVDRYSPVLGPNFQPVSVSFDTTLGTALSANGSDWTVTTPAHKAATVPVTGVTNMFAGTTPGVPATASFNAGTFTYADAPALAATGTHPAMSWVSGLLVVSSILLGAVLMATARKRDA